jgi:hypothetical protein
MSTTNYPYAGIQEPGTNDATEDAKAVSVQDIEVGVTAVSTSR